MTGPTLAVFQPADGAEIIPFLERAVQVTGQATDKGLPEPVGIDSITVQVDDGPAEQATRTHVTDKNLTIVNFAKTVTIPAVAGVHVITVTATDDNHLSTVRTVNVFLGPPFQIAPAAALAEVAVPPGLLPEVTPAVVSRVTQDIQHLLRPTAATLASSGLTVAGPNIVTDPSAGTIRVGLWAGAADFPAVPADPPDFPLPRLSDTQAAACFAATPPILPAGDGFALSVPTSTLQQVLNALSPKIVAAGARHDFTVQSLTVTTSPPGTVSVEVSGHLPLNVSASMTISETIGLKPLGQTNQHIPAVLSTESSASDGDLLEWLIPILNIALDAIAVYLTVHAGDIANEATGIIAPLLSLIPYDIPFRNTDLSASQALPLEFPVLRLYWKQFGATETGLIGAGTVFPDSRTQDEVSLTLDGPTSITEMPENLGTQVPVTLAFTMRELDPDDGTFGWQITGPQTTSGLTDASPFVQTGVVSAYLQLPRLTEHQEAAPVESPVAYNYTMTVSATETCGTDPDKTLTASWSSPVTVTVGSSSLQPPVRDPSGPAPVLP